MIPSTNNTKGHKFKMTKRSLTTYNCIVGKLVTVNEYLSYFTILRDHPLFLTIFTRVQRVRCSWGEGVNPVVHLVFATVLVHEISLANQHFYSMLVGRGRGMQKEDSLYMAYTLVKMLKQWLVP